jgi:hypothetical protein
MKTAIEQPNAEGAEISQKSQRKPKNGFPASSAISASPLRSGLRLLAIIP